MGQSQATNRYMRRIINLDGYLLRRDAEQILGWVNNSLYFEGKSISQKEFDERFPEKDLKYSAVQLDKRHIEK